jgi:hypothetical protein
VLIVTDFRTSMTALDVVSTSMHGIGEIGHPMFPATQVMAHPGTHPTITVPVVAGRSPDVDALWAFLAEPAEFFGFAMPGRADLSDAMSKFVTAVGDTAVGDTAVGDAPDTKVWSLGVTVAECGGAAQFVVTGAAVQLARREAVRIDVCDAAFPRTRPADPRWRRMAARTTSRAEEDQLRRWLDRRGYVDAVSSGAALGVPFLGALVFERAGDVCGVEHVEPTSILTQLERCGAVGSMRRADNCPADAERVWWISPGYERHPVDSIGATSYVVDETAIPAFARVP